MAQTPATPRRGQPSANPAVPSAAPDRSPPHSPEAEEHVIACCLLDGSDTIARCLEARLSGDAFYSPANRLLFETMVELYQKNPPVSLEILAEELKTRRQLEAVGGFPYLMQVTGRIPTTAHAGYFIEKVREKHLLRELIKTATGAVEQCYSFSGGLEEFVDKVEQELFKVTQDRVSDSAEEIKESIKEANAVIAKLMMKKGELTGVTSGFKDLDAMTFGFQKQEMIVVAARPSMGKCLAHDSEVLLMDGSVATMAQLHERNSGNILTLTDCYTFREIHPSHYVDDGIKPIYRVTTRLGRSVEATLPHPFLTIEGWTKLEHLKPGTAIGVPRALPVFGDQSARDCQIKLLAYLLGDGTITRSSPLFTNSNPRLRQEFAAAAAEFGGMRVRDANLINSRTPTLRLSTDWVALGLERRKFANRLRNVMVQEGMRGNVLAKAVGVTGGSISNWRSGHTSPQQHALGKLSDTLNCSISDLAPSGPESISKNAPNPVDRWLDSLGLGGSDAYGKFLPEFVFTLRREKLALFLNRLFATDGWASVSSTGCSQIGYATVSERLARQTCHLLLRFGILASCKKKKVRYEGEIRQCFQLIITDQESLGKFCGEIGIFGKEEAVEKVRKLSRSRRRQTNRDLIPKEIWKQIADRKGHESWASLARRAGIKGTSNIHVGKRSLSRSRLRAIAAALSDASLGFIADSQVYWDEIVSIEPAGSKQVYDLTIPDTHNFVANDLCVHNTSFALNIAEAAAMPKPGKADPVPTLVFSLEMSSSQLALRMLCSRARVNLKLLRDGLVSRDGREVNALGQMAEEFKKAPILIDDSSNLTIMEMRAKARRIYARKKLGLIVVDYLQLVSGSDPRAPREQQVAEVSRGLKAMAKELDLPVIVLSQLNRSSEKENRTPRLSDLRESGSIEQDADVVLMLSRPKDSDERFQTAAGAADLIVAKQRNGPVGDLKLTFLQEITRFENFTP